MKRSSQPIARLLGALALLCLPVTWSQPAAVDESHDYPAMAPIGQYRMASEAAEIALAKSAAPASVADHAEVLVLGERGYVTSVKGTNGFVCLVVRSWDMGFDSPEFWNPKIHTAQCMNDASAKSVLPRYLYRSEWALAAVSKAEMQTRETAEWASGKLKAPEPGAMCYMMSKGSYLNDDAGGPWRPHVMFFVPRTNAEQWGADLPGSPMKSDSTNYEKTTIFMTLVQRWSDGTPGPDYK
jgi:hypothetical protein